METSQTVYEDVIIFSVAGRIDYDTSEVFRTRLNDAIKCSCRSCDRIVLDLDGVDYVNSVGLHSVTMACQTVKAEGGIFAISSPNAVVREIFQTSCLDRIFNCYGSVDGALADISAKTPRSAASSAVLA